MAGGIRDGKGNILKNTDPLFQELTENYPHGKYTSFCNEFGVKYDKSEQIRYDNRTLQKALNQVLNKWLTNGKEVTRKKLESALDNTETAGLICIVKKHFAKSAEKDESGKEEADNNQRDITQAGSTTVQSNATTGPIYVTNNFTTEAGDRKRNADESDGPSDNKMKAKTMSMTDRHRKILEKSAPDLLKDLDAGDVTHDMLGVGIITTDDVAKIESKATRKDQVAALLDILPRRGDGAYVSFLKILEKTKGSSHLYQSVKNIEETFMQEQDPSEENVPISQGAKSSSSNTDHPSGAAGNTFTQTGANMTINASDHSTVQNTTLIGQVNNMNKK